MSSIKNTSTILLDNNIIEPRRQTEIDRYFSKLTSPHLSAVSDRSLKIVSPHLAKSQYNLQRSIKKGKLYMKEQSDDLSELLIKQKIDQQQIKTGQLRIKRDQLIKCINRLDMRESVQTDTSKMASKKYSHPDLLKFLPDGVLSRQEHQNMVEKIRIAQEERDRNHENYLQNLRQTLQEQQNSLKQAEQQRNQNQKQLRKMKSEHNIVVRKENLQKKISDQIKSKLYLQHLKKNPPLYMIKEQKFNKQVTAPSLEEKKKKLKEIRQFSKNFSVKDINNHQKKYLSARDLSIKQSKVRNSIDQQWAYKKPSRTNKLTHLLKEQMADHKKNLEEKQKAIQQKILRQQNFVRLLKQKYYPQKINPELKKQLETRVQKLHTQRIQTPEKSTRQIGKQYLTQVKNTVENSQQRSRMNKSLGESSAIVKSNVSQVQNYLKTKQDPGYYAEKRRKNLDKLLASKDQDQQKQIKLRIETQKIEEALQRKQQILKIKNTSETRKDTADLMLSGIKAKMGLIKLCQEDCKNPQKTKQNPQKRGFFS